jgi:hypothetical protein
MRFPILSIKLPKAEGSPTDSVPGTVIVNSFGEGRTKWPGLSQSDAQTNTYARDPTSGFRMKGDYTHPMKKDVKEKNSSPPLGKMREW